MKDNERLMHLLGICRRASRLSCGHDAALGEIRSRQARLCLISSDASERLVSEMRREAQFDGREIPVRVLDETMQDIGHATGLKSAVMTVNDEGFAKSMLGLLDTEEVVE